MTHGFFFNLSGSLPKPPQVWYPFFPKKMVAKNPIKKIYSFFSEIHVSSQGQLLGKQALKISDQMELPESRYLRRHIKKIENSDFHLKTK